MNNVSFLKSTWNYLSAQVATKGIAFISIPIFTRLMSPQDYGILNVLGSFSGILIPMVTLNFAVGLGRYFFDQEKNDFNAFFTSSILFCISGFVLIFLLSLIFVEWFSALIDLPTDAIYYLIPTSFLTFLLQVTLTVLRAEKKSQVYRRVTVVRGYVGFMLSVAFMYFLTESIYLGKLYSNVVILVSMMVWFFTYFRKYFKLNIKKAHFKYMFNYGFPLIPANLSAVILIEVDRVMINSSISSSEAGLYSFAYNISMLLSMFSNAFQYAFVPNYYKLMNNKDYNQIDNSFDIIITLVSAAAIGLIMFSVDLGMLLGSSSFYSSLYLIPLILIGQYFLTFVPLYKQNISFAKKTYYSTISILSAGLINVALNLWLIPVYGAKAAAITTIISYAFQFAIVYLIVRYLIKLHVFPLKKVLRNLVLVGLSVLIYYTLLGTGLDGIVNFLVKLVITLGLLSLLLFPKKKILVNMIKAE